MKTYLFSYEFNGKQWGFSIDAESEEEARMRVVVIGMARYDGELVGTVAASDQDIAWGRQRPDVLN